MEKGMIKEKINKMSLKKILIIVATLVLSFSILHEIVVLLIFRSVYHRVESSIHHTEKRMNTIRERLEKRDEEMDRDFDEAFAAADKMNQESLKKFDQEINQGSYNHEKN
jgi:hypothetical protein